MPAAVPIALARVQLVFDIEEFIMTAAADKPRVARSATAASAAVTATIAVSSVSTARDGSRSTSRRAAEPASASISAAGRAAEPASASLQGTKVGAEFEACTADYPTESYGDALATGAFGDAAYTDTTAASYTDADLYADAPYTAREYADGESPRVTAAEIAAAKAAGKTPRKSDLAGLDTWEEDAASAAMRKLRNDTIRTSRVRMTRSDEGYITQMVDALLDPESFGSRGDWIQHAKCRDMDPDALFVAGAAQREAAAICRHCPVVLQCRADALDNRVEFGVWGGLTERQRRALLKAHPEVESWAEFYAGKVRPLHQQQQRRSHTV